MEKRLVIDLSRIPEEGKQVEGEIDRKVFDLPDRLAVPESGIRYRLDLLPAGSELLVRGSLETVFQLQCVRTLEYFPHTVALDDYAESFPAGNSGSVDLTDRLREDILLALPAYPRKDGPAEAGAERSEPPSPEAAPDHAWDALNRLDISKPD